MTLQGAVMQYVCVPRAIHLISGQEHRAMGNPEMGENFAAASATATSWHTEHLRDSS